MSPLSGTASSRLTPDRLSLLTKIARMYHEQGLRQPEIAARLHISQSRVSRFLKEATEIGVVRTVVISPPGVHGELEDALVERYSLADAVLVDVGDTEHDASVITGLAGAGAAYLEMAIEEGERIGISSWSATLLGIVDVMSPRTAVKAAEVVQLIGGVGDPAVQVQANRLTERLARLTHADPVTLPSPGVVASPALRDALLADDSINAVTRRWDHLTMALVGVGSLAPSPMLAESGNAVRAETTEELRAAGAVGDVCLRYFDTAGVPIHGPLHDRTVGIDLDQLARIPRRIGVAGGHRKRQALRASLVGGIVNVLITDTATARFLLDRDDD